MPTYKTFDISEIKRPENFLEDADVYIDIGFKIYCGEQIFVIPKDSVRYYDVVPAILNGIYINLP